MSGYTVPRALEPSDVEHDDDRPLEQWLAPEPQRKGHPKREQWPNASPLCRECDPAGCSTLVGEAETA